MMGGKLPNDVRFTSTLGFGTVLLLWLRMRYAPWESGSAGILAGGLGSNPSGAVLFCVVWVGFSSGRDVHLAYFWFWFFF